MDTANRVEMRNYWIGVFMKFLQQFPNFFNMENLQVYNHLGKKMCIGESALRNAIYTREIPKSWYSYKEEKNRLDQLMISFTNAIDEYVDEHRLSCKKNKQEPQVDIKKWGMYREISHCVVVLCCVNINILSISESVLELASLDDFSEKYAYGLFYTSDFNNVVLKEGAGRFLEAVKNYKKKHPHATENQTTKFFYEVNIIMEKSLLYEKIMDKHLIGNTADHIMDFLGLVIDSPQKK